LRPLGTVLSSVSIPDSGLELLSSPMCGSGYVAREGTNLYNFKSLTFTKWHWLSWLIHTFWSSHWGVCHSGSL
jgi:hypothetical protein